MYSGCPLAAPGFMGWLWRRRKAGPRSRPPSARWWPRPLPAAVGVSVILTKSSLAESCRTARTRGNCVRLEVTSDRNFAASRHSDASGLAAAEAARYAHHRTAHLRCKAPHAWSARQIRWRRLSVRREGRIPRCRVGARCLHDPLQRPEMRQGGRAVREIAALRRRQRQCRGHDRDAEARIGAERGDDEAQDAGIHAQPARPRPGRDEACAPELAAKFGATPYVHVEAAGPACEIACPKLNCTGATAMCFDIERCTGVDIWFGRSLTVARLRYS